MNKIAFLLPVCERTPGGGSKIMFEYANYFAQKGYNVKIYFCAWKLFNKKHIPKWLKKSIQKFIVRIRPRWFKLDKKIIKKAIFSISDDEIDDNDVLITTNVVTVNDVAKLNDSKGIKINLIQGLENWTVTDRELFDTYRAGLLNITVSKWLADIVERETNKKCECIANGINTHFYKEIVPVEERNSHSIIFHYRDFHLKGCTYALKTLEILSKKYNDLQITVISNQPKLSNIPSNYRYIYNASFKDIVRENNNSAIFMCSTIEEGFGLPGLEAMACGCALVTTDYLGGKEYAEHGRNALISAAKDYKTMAENISTLMDNNEKRIKIAKQGIIDAKNHSIENSAKKLESIILKELEK